MQRQPRPVEPPPEPPAEPPERPKEPPPEAVPPSFGLKLSGTAKAPAGQGVQVPEGDTLKASPTQRRQEKDKDKPVAPPSGHGFKKDYTPGEKAPLAVATTLPKMVKKVVPEYPEKARELGIEGRVMLELTVDGEGKVIDVRIVKGLHPVLDAAAVEAAKKMRFQPGTVNGTPVTLKIPVPFTFVLD
jgi:protein TonB